MRKLGKKLMGVTLSLAMVVGSVPASNLINLDKIVQAAENPLYYADSYVVDLVIPDINLLLELKQIIKGSQFATLNMGELRNYTGKITLTNTDISDVSGLGYAMNASEIDMSKLVNVKTIFENEFTDCNFTKVLLPSKLQKIEKAAFLRCHNLLETQIPETCVSIGASAFMECYKLNGIKLPERVEFIGNEAFANCTSLTQMVIPDYINAMVENSGEEATKGMGENVFSGCSSLVSIKLGAAMTAIPAGTFRETSSLEAISIPEKISSIRSSAFEGSGIKSIDISKNKDITVIQQSVFLNCHNLSRVVLPDNITSIESNAFAHCMSLDDTNFISGLNSLKTIAAYAFYGAAIKLAVIPSNVEVIDEYAFYQCQELINVNIKDFTKSIAGTLTKKIGDYAFAESTSLEEVILPTTNQDNINVKIEIGKHAFDSCVHLETINFPKNITLIDDYAFNKCAKSVADWAVTTDEYEGFYTGNTRYTSKSNLSLTKDEAKGLVDAVYLYSLDAGEEFYQPVQAYVDKTQLRTVAAAGDISVVIQEDGGNQQMNLQMRSGLQYVDLSKCERLTLGEGAFAECTNLISVTLPDALTTIPKKAFYKCATDKLTGNGKSITLNEKSAYEERYYGLTNVYMSDNVTEIGESAFEKCYRLELSNDLPDNLQSIGKKAFMNCYSLKGITLPRTLKVISESAFQECSVVYGETVMADIGLPSVYANGAISLEYIGKSAFEDDSFAQFILSPDAPIDMVDDSAFENCQFLKAVQFGNNVRYIGKYALATCLRLDSVTVSDRCTFNIDVCNGGVNAKYLPKEESFYYYEQESATSTTKKFTTSQFVVRITPVTKDLTLSENQVFTVPLNTIDASTGYLSYFAEVMVGDYTYAYDGDTGELVGDTVNSPMIPSMVKTTYSVPANDYHTAKNNLNALIVNLTGKKEVADVTVVIQEQLNFRTNNAGSVISYTPSVTYTVDVTGNPCKEIVAEDSYYVAKGGSNTIKPEFVSEHGGEPTDVPSWKIESGSEFIELTVAADKKSATVKSTGSYGTARVTVNAGAVSKTFYVQVSDKSSSISITRDGDTVKADSTVNLMLNSTADIAVKTSYSSSSFVPEGVLIKSSDENIVKVENIEADNNMTTCKLRGVKTGTATISVYRQATNKTTNFNVKVTARDLKVVLKDSDGKNVTSGSTVTTINKNGVTFNYGFNSDIDNQKLSYTVSDSSIATVSFNEKIKEITIKGAKKGSTKLTIYPSIGNATENGFVLNVVVNADVKSISLAKKTIELGQTESIFSGMENVFVTSSNKEGKISVASSASFKSITDNTIVFTSSAPTYATVDSYGNVTAKKLLPNDAELVKITCTAYRGNQVIKSQSTTITIKKRTLKDITLSGVVKDLYIGNTAKIKITPNPIDSEYTSVSVSQAYNQKKIASVTFNKSNNTVTVKGLAKGKTTLTITIKNGYTNTVSKTVSINIKEKPVYLKTGGKPSISKPKAAKKQVTIKWKKMKGATGYQVQMSKKKSSGFKQIKKTNAKTLKFVKKKLTSKKTYYFRVRAIGKNAKGKKVYSKWSKVVKAKVK